MTETAYTPNQRTEQRRIQSMGSGDRAAETVSTGIKDMRIAVKAAADSGNEGKAFRIAQNLHRVEKTLGR